MRPLALGEEVPAELEELAGVGAGPGAEEGTLQLGAQRFRALQTLVHRHELGAGLGDLGLDEAVAAGVVGFAGGGLGELAPRLIRVGAGGLELGVELNQATLQEDQPLAVDGRRGDSIPTAQVSRSLAPFGHDVSTCVRLGMRSRTSRVVRPIERNVRHGAGDGQGTPGTVHRSFGTRPEH